MDPDHRTSPTAPPRARLGVPAPVWALGIVSLLADLGSELAYPIVPVFLVATLGASPLVVGVIEGLAEGTAAALRPASGWISDRMRRRRPPLVSLGYGLSALGRVLLPLAPGWGAVLAARLVDRVGKGVRTAPRDAIIADVTPPEIRGRAFGLHRSMDTIGAVGGPLLALLALAVVGDDRLRLVLLLAAVPAAAAVLVTFRIPEPERRAVRTARPAGGRPPLPGRFWLFMAGWGIFALGNSSDAFLILRAGDVLGSATAAVAAYALYNVVAATASLPAGIASDRWGRRPLLLGGLAVFAAVYAVAASAPSAWLLVVAIAAYGGYLAMTDGVSRALVSSLAPPERRGAVLGLFAGVTAAAAVVASIVGGLLWDRLGPGWTFGYGAAMALAGAAVLAVCPMGGRPAD